MKPADSITDPIIKVWRSMLELHAVLIGDLEEQFRDRHAMSVSDFDVLINIAPDETVRHKELVTRVILTRTALTRLLDRLCRRGWVARDTVPGDQRGVLVTLTEEGRRVRQAALSTNDNVVRAHFSGLDATELDELERLITRIRLHSRQDHPQHEKETAI